MERNNFTSLEEGRAASSTLRDLASVAFRHRRVATLAFLGVVLGAALAAILLPPQYEAHLKILVKHERVDPVVTSESNAVTQLTSQLVTEEDLNTEVELIKSRDLLEKVVEACGLHLRPPSFWAFLRRNSAMETDLRVAEAVRKLDGDLKVEPVKKSNMIEVSYASPDPVLSSHVLTALANEYLVKHLTVHRPPGAFDFFQQQAEQYGKALAAAEQRLAGFSREQGQGAVSPQIQRDLVLQKAAEFEATLGQTQASIAQTQERIRTLEAQMAATPVRLNTTDRKSDNAALLGQLKSDLLTLELKRTELLGKFEPGYRPVQEVEAQIAQTRAAIAAAENAPVREESTDRNPTYQFLDEELAKARADLASYQGQAEATRRVLEGYHEKALFLDQKDIVQQDLIRTSKAEEANYLLYLNKREEARISDALDNKRIANVSIAETPNVPPLPVHSPWLFVLLGVLLGTMVSLGAAFVADYFDSSFRTADELGTFLNTPVLAAFPKSGA